MNMGIIYRGDFFAVVGESKGLLVVASAMLRASENLRQEILLNNLNSTWKQVSRVILSVEIIGLQRR